MRRLVAFGIAVALIVVAVVVRHRIDNGSGGGDKLRLVCAPELEEACRSLGSDVDVSVEEPGTTADRLEKAGNDLGVDGWLTPGPWPQIVAEARQRDGKDPGFQLRPLGVRSRVGLAFYGDRFGVLHNFCPNHDVNWHCLGDAAVRGKWSDIGGLPGWGAVKFAIPDPSDDATGLAALGAATAGYFGKTTLSSTDLDDAGFRGWLRALATSNADHPSLEEVLARGPAEAGGAVTIEAVGRPAVSSSARAPKPTLAYPAPVASADVVLGSAGTDAGRRLAASIEGNVRSALLAAGWVNGPSVGLPPAGLLDALRSVWEDAAR
jgi:hypothetical protein